MAELSESDQCLNIESRILAIISNYGAGLSAASRSRLVTQLADEFVALGRGGLGPDRQARRDPPGRHPPVLVDALPPRRTEPRRSATCRLLGEMAARSHRDGRRHHRDRAHASPVQDVRGAVHLPLPQDHRGRDQR